MKSVFLIAFTLFLAGCVTTARQTEILLKNPPTNLKRSVEIPHVPFIDQAVGHCGPATLAMVMNWNGRPISVQDLASQVYTPGMKGSFQADMISASRRNSMMAVQIEGLPSLLNEVSAGHPVIVFENLALTWAPRYHYAVVYGYDLDQEKIIMHSGPEIGKRWDLRKFERSWILGDYWGLVVLPPGQLAASGTELAHVTAAAGLEQLSKIDEAEKSYLAILKNWPESLGALIGMGNLSYEKKEYKNSVEYLRRAVAAHPESAAAKHNLAFAEKEIKKFTKESSKLNTLRK
ncbi:MAG: PA2778 family cysteine peptidase [Bdellovibrionota bacterium]